MDSSQGLSFGIIIRFTPFLMETISLYKKPVGMSPLHITAFWNEKQATKAEEIVLSREVFVEELNKAWYLRRDNVLEPVEGILNKDVIPRKTLNDFNLEIWCMKQLETEELHELMFDKGEWPTED